MSNDVVGVWIWTLNFDEIRSDLVIGSCPRTAADLEQIRERSEVNAVLSMQSDACLEHFRIDYACRLRRGRALGLQMARVPMKDFEVLNRRRRLPDVVRALARLLRDGRRVYLPCTAGSGCSPWRLCRI